MKVSPSEHLRTSLHSLGQVTPNTKATDTLKQATQFRHLSGATSSIGLHLTVMALGVDWEGSPPEAVGGDHLARGVGAEAGLGLREGVAVAKWARRAKEGVMGGGGGARATQCAISRAWQEIRAPSRRKELVHRPSSSGGLELVGDVIGAMSSVAAPEHLLKSPISSFY